jgi:hypothetical protein
MAKTIEFPVDLTPRAIRILNSARAEAVAAGATDFIGVEHIFLRSCERAKASPRRSSDGSATRIRSWRNWTGSFAPRAIGDARPRLELHHRTLLQAVCSQEERSQRDSKPPSRSTSSFDSTS